MYVALRFLRLQRLNISQDKYFYAFGQRLSAYLTVPMVSVLPYNSLVNVTHTYNVRLQATYFKLY